MSEKVSLKNDFSVLVLLCHLYYVMLRLRMRGSCLRICLCLRGLIRLL